jgi:hypothetical protein
VTKGHRSRTTNAGSDPKRAPATCPGLPRDACDTLLREQGRQLLAALDDVTRMAVGLGQSTLDRRLMVLARALQALRAGLNCTDRRSLDWADAAATKALKRGGAGGEYEILTMQAHARRLRDRLESMKVSEDGPWPRNAVADYLAQYLETDMQLHVTDAEILAAMPGARSKDGKPANFVGDTEAVIRAAFRLAGVDASAVRDLFKADRKKKTPTLGS